MKSSTSSFGPGSVLFAAVFAVAGLTSVNAALTDITSSYLPRLVTVRHEGAPLASQSLAVSPCCQGDTQIFDWLKAQVPAGDPAAFNRVLDSGTTMNLGNLSAYAGDYLVVHWGGGEAGNKFFCPNAKGGFEEAFLISGSGLGSVTLTLPSFTGYYCQGHGIRYGTLDVGELSCWRVYGGVTPVPEPSAFLAACLCLSVAAGSCLRRRA